MEVLLSKNMIVANVSNAGGMLEQVVNCFHEKQTNLEFYVDDTDFLGV